MQLPYLTTICLGLQPWQLPTSFGSAPIYQPLVVAHSANQVDQDRSESCQARPLHLLPDGGSVGLTKFVRGHPETDSTTDAAGAGVTTQPVSEIEG